MSFGEVPGLGGSSSRVRYGLELLILIRLIFSRATEACIPLSSWRNLVVSLVNICGRCFLPFCGRTATKLAFIRVFLC